MQRNIVHILTAPNVGGVEMYVLGLMRSKALSQYRHSVIFLESLEGTQGDLYEQFRRVASQVALCTYPFQFGKQLPAFSRHLNQMRVQLRSEVFKYRFKILLQKLAADVVHIHTLSYLGQQATTLSHQTQIPWIWTVHGLCLDPNIAHIVSQIEQSNAYLTVVSESAKEYITHVLGREVKCLITPGGVDLSRLDQSVKRRHEWRQKRGVPVNALLYGSLGRLSEEKNYGMFIEAAATLINSGLQAHFAVAGDGPLHDYYVSQIEQLGLQSYFHLVGVETDISHFLKQLDVFVLPSLTEGFPLALVEAMTMGLPCIASRVGGIPTLLGQDAGLMVDPLSIEDLVNALQAMAVPEVRRNFATKGPIVAQHYSIENCAAQFAALYRELINTES